MHITFLGIKESEKEFLKKEAPAKFAEHTVVFIDEPDADHIPPETEILSVFVASDVTKEVMEKLPNLRYIATRSTGFDHIDLAFAKERGIIVSNVPTYGSTTVAEFTFALLLTLSRKIYDAYDQVRSDGDFRHDALVGFDLEGKTLGVVGTGKIGQNVIRIANGFNMRVIAYDAFPNESLKENLSFTYVSKEVLLSESDIITLHVPYMNETHHFLSDDEFRMMKNGAYLVNTSRGPVTDTEALFRALKDGQIAGAALDVLEEEAVMQDEAGALLSGLLPGRDINDIIANHAMIDMPNVIVTPHVAYNTKEAIERILETSLGNITSFIEGTPQNTL